MGKQKTHKGLKKRVKVTGTGKIKRKRAGAGHLMSSKNAKHRRRVTGSTLVSGASARTAKVRLGKA
jgi:large subunit ribosomal protein L35